MEKLESAAESVVTKLGQVLVEELQEIRGVGDKVVQLTDELATMNAVLRVLSEADESAAANHLLREWEKQVHELAYDAEDCADVYRLRICRPKPSILKWPKYQLKKLWLKRTLAADIKALLARTCAVSERRARYHIDLAALPRAPWFAPAILASASALQRADDPADQFVGMKEQVDTLAERIKAIDDAEDDSSRGRRLKVFSIVGFGGLGKTTLAVELCRKLESDFQRQAVVSVSQAFDGGNKDMRGLLARLLPQIVKLQQDDKQTNTQERITEEVEATAATHANQLQIEGMGLEDLPRNLNELLKEKRYLIVIDDVWSQAAWEAIRIRLPENNCGSRIIVTTRIETVAKASSVLEDFIHHMQPLEPGASEELFVKRVFGSKGTCPVGLNEAMGKILKKCGGLPLAIVKIASILASYNSTECVDMWTRLSDSIGSQMERHPTLEGMRQVIALSYSYLPHHLKACMLYLSIFPEDYVIAKDRLLYRRIAEGLVAEKRGLTLFDVAEEYFNELISRTMIQADKLPMLNRYIGELEMVEACRVHDMLLEVMVLKSQEANFVCLVGRQYGGGLARGKVRRLSVHGGNDEDEEDHSSSHHRRRASARHGGIEAMKLQHVRSLSTFQVEGGLGNKLLDRLGEFRLLRVLDLDGCKALEDKHMRDVCRLYLLRYLGLRDTQISVMPNKIGDLEYLESLDVDETRIVNMPATVTKLSKLERLRARRWLLPRGLGNMKALREVDLAALEGNNDVQVAQEIGELQQLQVLCIRIGLTKDMEDNKREEFLHALASSLSKTYALQTLKLFNFRNYGVMEFLLHVSSPPPLLRCLHITGPISRLSDWIASLKHLTEFSVAFAKLAGDHLLDSLSELPSLQSLTLGYNSCRDQELVARTKHKFPALKILEMSFEDVPQLLEFEPGSMTKLETLRLTFYIPGDRSIVGTGNLKNLKEVKLHGRKGVPSLERALQQLKEEIENRLNSNQIKLVMEYW